MKGRFLIIVTLTAVFSGAQTGSAQSDLSIGQVDIPSLRWGRQTATFEVTNNSDWIKYVTVETHIKFQESYLNPERTVYRHYPLEPGESRILAPEIDIPGNYGEAVLYVRLYDVVDTLDAILPGQKVFEQPFSLFFHVPDEVISYLQEKVLLPPMVANNPVWDNEFAHLLPLLLKEGKSIEEIAFMTRSDTSFVRDAIDRLVKKRFFLRNEDGSVSPGFPVFLVKQAEDIKSLLEGLSDQMATLIERNMSAYRAVMDSLIDVGALTKDSNDFLHGGTVLYRPYPVIAALLLWYDLGQAFLAGRTRLTIFDGTDPCNALIGQYMYAVQGGDVFSGHHYYRARVGERLDITFGDSIPKIICKGDFTSKAHLKERIDYYYQAEYMPEIFMVSAGLVAPALQALGKGAHEMLVAVRDGLVAVSADHGHEYVTVGERYWCWNQFATRTLEKLVDRGVVGRRGNGQYRFTVSQ